MINISSNQKYSGVLSAVVIAGIFTAISLLGLQFFNGTAWYLFSSALRFVFGFIILYAVNKIYQKPASDIFTTKGFVPALIAGLGFIVYFAYYLLVWCSGVKSITGLTSGILISRIILQQIATGFFEELNFRMLILEGYFHGNRTLKNRLIYAFLSFLIFGAIHVVTGWNTYTFLQTGIIGFSFAVMYLKSGNILLPMFLHFIYDIFANLANYIEWNDSALFVSLNSVFDLSLIVMFVISFVMLTIKEKALTRSA